MIVTIERSVGRRSQNAANVPKDVAILQNHLTTLSELLGRPEYGTGGIDGAISHKEDTSGTIKAIEAFQFANQLAVDGVAGSSGETFRNIKLQLTRALGSANDGNPNAPGGAYFPFTSIPKDSWKSGGRAFGAARDEGKRLHAGCDLYFKAGTWIYAMADGEVVRGPYPFYAHTFALEVDHGTYIARYGEIRPSTVVQQGDRVRAGQRIAMVGHLIGINVTSDMLHLETYSGKLSGSLTVYGRASKTDSKGKPFNRRKDLLDPTERLDGLKKNLPKDFQVQASAFVVRAPHEEPGIRQVNEAGVEMVKDFEGFRSDAYRCPAGVWTIGYGHTGSVRSGQTIGKTEAEALLRKDLAEAGADVRRLIEVPLNANQFAALASFTFNVGAGNLSESTLRKKLNQGKYDTVPSELNRWNKATVNGIKTVLAGLVRRRAAEGVLWLTPVDEAPDTSMPQSVDAP